MSYTAGPCAAAEHCRGYDPHTRQPGVATTHRLCDTCLRVTETAVHALPLDWRDLEQLLPPALVGWRGDGQPHARSIGVPLNLAAEALQHAIWWATTAWEEVARDMHRLAAPPHRRDGCVEHPSARSWPLRPGGADVVRACRVLAPRLGPLSDLSAVPMLDYPLVAKDDDTATIWRSHTHTVVTGAQGVHDLLRLHNRARAMLGLTQPVRSLPGTCSAKGCGRADLTQHQPRYPKDEQPVVCGGCGASQTYDDYRRAMDNWMVAA